MLLTSALAPAYVLHTYARATHAHGPGLTPHPATCRAPPPTLPDQGALWATFFRQHPDTPESEEPQSGPGRAFGDRTWSFSCTSPVPDPGSVVCACGPCLRVRHRRARTHTLVVAARLMLRVCFCAPRCRMREPARSFQRLPPGLKHLQRPRDSSSGRAIPGGSGSQRTCMKRLQ